MKKITLACLALLFGCAWFTPATAQESSTATKVIYDFSGFSDKVILDLFYNALQQGRNYPTQAEFEAAGIQASDLAFVRSHVKPGTLLSRADRVVPTTYETRSLWMNIPMGIGAGGDAAYPRSTFNNDVFSMWNYTNVFGTFNHGLFKAPGAWVDAAHKNGTDIVSGVKSIRSLSADDGDWGTITSARNDDGSFKYVKPLINALMYFGSDGINYNWESGPYDNADLVAFHKALYAEAKAQKFDNFHIGMWVANGPGKLDDENVDALYGSSTGKTADVLIRHSNNDFAGDFGETVTKAEESLGNADGVYGLVATADLDKNWMSLDNSVVTEFDWELGEDVTTIVPDAQAHKIGVAIWGEWTQSRFFSYASGMDSYDVQSSYQNLLERGFSGGNNNPLTRPAVTQTGSGEVKWEGSAPLKGFCGLAEFIPERSAISGNLPFATHFNLGNGDRYNYKGKKTALDWYNMANQDRVPTWRWLVVKAGTENTVADNIEPRFTHKDAYTGGSCLRLSGNADAAGTDIILYKTNLKVSAANPYIRIATKAGKAGVSGLYVILKKSNGTWVELPVPATKAATWQEDIFDATGLAQNDVIERIGLRVKGSGAFDLMVGKLEINTAVKANPVKPTDFTVEVKEETKSSLSIKAFWNVSARMRARMAWNLLYNDEANIDHFELFYKNGANGRVSEIGRTTQWATYIGNILLEDGAQPYIGLRSVSTDLKTYSDIQWVQVQRAAASTLPESDYDTYGTSQINPSSEGVDIARRSRFLTEVSTTGAVQNLNYHATAPVADGTQYADARDHVLKVRQGQTIELFVKANETWTLDGEGNILIRDGEKVRGDGLRYCFGGGWMDLNGSGTFDHPLGQTPWEYEPDEATDPEGERIFKIGRLRNSSDEIEATGLRTTFTIPADATPGPSRLRMVFSDAWFAGMFAPTGLTAKGFSIDFSVEIEGTNPARQYVDQHDQGIADEPDLSGDVTAIKAVDTNPGFSRARISNGTIDFTEVEKAWIYTADGRLVKFVKDNPGSVSTAGYTPGTYLVKMQYKNVIRSQKVVIR